MLTMQRTVVGPYKLLMPHVMVSSSSLEIRGFESQVSYMRGLVILAKQDFILLNRFPGLWSSDSVHAPYPINALVII